MEVVFDVHLEPQERSEAVKLSEPTSRFPLWTLADAASLAGLDPKALGVLVNVGVVTPAVPGRRGRGGSHRFSCQQLYALAAIAVLIQTDQGCARTYARDVMQAFEGMSDSTLSEWMGLRADLHTEEEAASWLASPEANTVFAGFRQADPVLKDEDEATRKMLERHERIDRAIKARLEAEQRAAGGAGPNDPARASKGAI